MNVASESEKAYVRLLVELSCAGCGPCGSC